MGIRGDAVRVNRKEADSLTAEEERIKLRIQKVNDLYFDGEISKNDKDENITGGAFGWGSGWRGCALAGSRKVIKAQ